MSSFFFRNLLFSRKEKGKRQKRCSSSSKNNNNNNNNNCDHLIDRLPDDVLVHILSFLPTKDCVGSSTLGKRWSLLWARVPNLEFDSEDHKTWRSFSNLFNKFAFVHKGHNINTLRIRFDRWEDKENKSEIETMIGTAIERNVQAIEINSGFGFEIEMPRCLFTCKTLVVLTVKRVRVDPRTSVVCLPALKKLELTLVLYDSEESLVHLLSGCPALQELTILKNSDGVARLHLSSPTLTRLYLQTYSGYYKVYYELKLDTPALEYLWFNDCLFREWPAGMQLASLTEACVVFREGGDVHYSRSVLEFVGNMNNVSSLKLRTRSNWVEDPDSAFSALTTREFRNLTKLELIGNCRGDWRFVTCFLENSDNLKVLIIKMTNRVHTWMEPKRVPVCLKCHLEEVRFKNFKFSEAEFNAVEYILRNAKVLKRMEILRKVYNSHRDHDKRISLFERASEACELVFDWES